MITAAFGGMANAGPQISTGVQLGVAGVSAEGSPWQYTNFYGAVHGDVLFGRDSPLDVGIGPYAMVATSGFDDFRFGAGGSVLLPIHPDLPPVLSLGAYGRSSEPEWSVGVSGRMFWGLRSYNYHSVYGLAAGLFGGVDVDVTSQNQVTIVIGAQVDNEFLILPGLIVVNWLRSR